MPDPFPKTFTEPFTCKCEAELGQSYYAGATLVGVQFGGVMVEEYFHGRCVHCGRGIHITIPMKSLRKLLSHYEVEAKEISVEFTEIGETA